MGLFTKKSIGELQAEAEGSLLRRSLGPLNLTALGIGSIIGTGIFVLTGTAASQNAGPSLVLSMVISAIGCAFAGLCYAEFASMVPVAGSAYTYAYATVGELAAWIIGWDLILEYSLATATVAVGWSGYFVSLLKTLGIVVPTALAAPPFNLPAIVVVLLVTMLLVIGIKQSADTNTVLVVIKTLVLVLFVAVGARYVTREHLMPFIPPNAGEFGHFGWSGFLRGAGVMFFAYIGFDAVSTAAQEAKNPARDMPIGILGSLAICTVVFVLVALVLIGVVPYQQLNVADPLAVGIDANRGEMAQSAGDGGGALRPVQHDARHVTGADANFLHDEPRRAAAAGVCGRSSAISHAVSEYDRDRIDHRDRRRHDPNRGPWAVGEYRDSAGVRPRVPWRDPDAPPSARAGSSIPNALVAVCAGCGRAVVFRADGRAAICDLDAADYLAGRRIDDLFHVRETTRDSTDRAPICHHQWSK
jgi:hypothetical protein